VQFYLTRSNTFASAVIRARMSFSKKRLERWSHGLVLLPSRGCIDSTFKLGGVVERPLQDALKGTHPQQRRLLTVNLPREEQALQWGLDQREKPYDTRAVFGWGIGDRDWHDPAAWFCFEFIAAWIEAGSDYRFPDLRRVSGGDLEEAVRFLGGE
jgi:hypothetical protein